jgi:large repetitive protein
MARRFSTPVRLAVGSALALAGLALVAAPASAASKTTTTTVTESTGAQTGAPVTFTATVVPSSGVPTGSVAFTVTGASSTPYTCTGGDANLVKNPSGPGSVATCTFSAGLDASDSPYAVTAVYSGDSTYSTSTGNLSAKIHRGVTSTTVTSSSNPTVSGQPVDFTATVAPTSPATGTPTGSVTFSITGTGGGSATCDTTGDTVPLTGDVASCDIGAGLLAQYTAYTVSATYSGDSNFVTSTGSVSQNVDKATATIAVTSSAPGSIYTGQPVTFTATITGINPPGAGTPTGDVVFTIVGSDAVTVTCQGGDTQPLVGSSATCAFPKGLLARPLSYTVSATLKDPNYRTPVAGSVVQLMVKANTTTTVSGLAGSYVASQPFNININIATQTPGSGVPTGTIEWAICNYYASSCSGTDAPAGGTYALPTPTKKDIKNNEQNLTFAVPAGVVTPGFYYVQATFWGASDYQSSTSGNSYILIDKVPTSMDLFMSSNPVRNGNRLVIRSAIIASSKATPDLGAPKGTVTFSIVGASGDSLTCQTGTNVVPVSTTSTTQGFASCTIPLGIISTSDAPYEVQASYSGSADYDAVAASQAVAVKNLP